MGETSGVLKVRVVKGTRLAVRDFRTSDPYVVLRVGNQVAKTRVINSNLNPVWDEELSFIISSPPRSLKLVCLDLGAPVGGMLWKVKNSRKEFLNCGCIGKEKFRLKLRVPKRARSVDDGFNNPSNKAMHPAGATSHTVGMLVNQLGFDSSHFIRGLAGHIDFLLLADMLGTHCFNQIFSAMNQSYLTKESGPIQDFCPCLPSTDYGKFK